jgi:hypothetical protein
MESKGSDPERLEEVPAGVDRRTVVVPSAVIGAGLAMVAGDASAAERAERAAGMPPQAGPSDAAREPKQKRPAMMQFGTAWAALALALGLGGCGGAPPRQVQLGGQTVNPERLEPADVARQVTVTSRGDDTIYYAPTLASFRDADLRAGGPAVGRNLGTVRVGRQGFLFGVRKGAQPVVSYVAFQSNLIEGTGRYVAVTLADGTPLPIRTMKSGQTHCEPDCLLVFETVVAELPDAVLRAVPAEGLTLVYRLDNGAVARVVVPSAYVRGYLQAIDGTVR